MLVLARRASVFDCTMVNLPLSISKHLRLHHRPRSPHYVSMHCHSPTTQCWSPLNCLTIRELNIMPWKRLSLYNETCLLLFLNIIHQFNFVRFLYYLSSALYQHKLQVSTIIKWGSYMLVFHLKMIKRSTILLYGGIQTTMTQWTFCTI